MNRFRSLRCTAFEELMLAQDCASYPCNIYVRMLMSGELQRDHFTSAVRKVIEHHPLLRATVKTRLGRSTWVIQDSVEPSIQWCSYKPGDMHSAACLNLPTESKFELQRESGLSIVVLEPEFETAAVAKASQTLVALKIHHAVADGLAINSMVHDLWLAYDALVHQRPMTLSDVNVNRLPERNRFVSGFGALLRLIPKQLVGLLGVRQYLMRKPIPLVSRNAHQESLHDPMSFAAVSHGCCKAMTDALRQEAKQRRVSLNAYLATCVFRACNRFRAQREFVSATQGTSEKGTDPFQRDKEAKPYDSPPNGEPAFRAEWLRMMVPISLRTSEAFQRLPACNVVSSVFLDRRPAQIADFDQLAQSVHEEMELIKTKRLALMFIFSLWIRKQLTFSSKKPTVSRCQTSVVFSNLGKLFFKSPLRDKEQRVSPGKLKLESYEIYAPLTPWMDAAFTTLIYRDRLTLSLRYDPRWMSRVDAEQLLELVVAEFSHLQPAEALAS